MAALKYRTRHQKLRVIELRRLRPGIDVCRQVVAGVVCGQPMYRELALDLGHDDKGGYIGLVHARCNRQAGAINSNRGIVRKPLVLISGSGRKW